jgi:hypothetical protein
LGACRPPLAHAAVTAEPSIGLLLPCNVVVRAEGDQAVVEAMDPATMVHVTGNAALTPVADDARTRRVAALTALGGTPSPDPATTTHPKGPRPWLSSPPTT